jgi:hypothetical protein
LAGASLGLLAAAGTASSISDGRTAGRDAVRLVGRPALELPFPRFVAAASARWGLEALPWGPAYEPHRFPSGAPLAERLRLPAGAFTLEIRAERLDAGSPAPRLAVVEGDSGGETEVALAAEGDGYRACFERPRPSSDLTLRVRGGGAFLLEWVELRAQPSCAGPV